MLLYRSMKEAIDGFPEVGPGARLLGVRPGGRPKGDVSAITPLDPVVPRGGGMSTADDPNHLIPFRRPPSLGGTGPDPVWVIDSDDLGADLSARSDTATHVLVEPRRSMTLQSFQLA